MGDFERTFGAGADADAIIDRFSAAAAREADEVEEEVLDSGRDLPRALSFFDLTGQVWHPGPDPRARIAPPRLLEIDRLARDALAAFDAEQEVFIQQDWTEIARLFLVHAGPPLAKLGPSLDEFEAFLGLMVREEADIPLILARDAGPNAGYVSRTLSTHILAFPEEVYLARFGGLELEGPFSDFDSCGGWCVLKHDSYRAFASEGPERVVLEISDAVRDPVLPIRTARDWVAAEAGIGGGQTSFGTVASRAAARTPRCRSWSDAAEDALRARVRAVLAGLLPSDARVYVTLHARQFAPWLDVSYGATGSVPTELVGEVLDRFDVSGFRGSAPAISIVEGCAFSARERVAGRGVLLDFLEGIGVDASAAADALAREDYVELFQIVSPVKFEDACRSGVRDRTGAFEAALSRHGFAEEEVPF